MRCFLLLVSLAVLAGVTHADTIYVNAAATGAQDGTSWAAAFSDLQDGLATAQAGDEIWVAEGRYQPSRDGQRNRSFRISSGIRVYGGFAGHEDSSEQRDWLRCRTKLVGNIGDPRHRKDNVFRVVEAIDVDGHTMLDGFVIMNGYNDCSCPNNRGGGMYLENADLTVSHCTIRKNYAGGGGGMWIQSSRPLIASVTFHHNRGRAITTDESHPLFVSCNFSNNYTTADGAAIGSFSGSTSVVVNSSFVANMAGHDGGAYFGMDAGSFLNCIFVGNSCNEWGGAVRQWRGPVELTNCSFYDNSTNW